MIINQATEYRYGWTMGLLASLTTDACTTAYRSRATIRLPVRQTYTDSKRPATPPFTM